MDEEKLRYQAIHKSTQLLKVHAYQHVQTPPWYHGKPLSNRLIECNICNMKRTEIRHTPPFAFLARLALCIASSSMAKRPKAPFYGERSSLIDLTACLLSLLIR